MLWSFGRFSCGLCIFLAFDVDFGCSRGLSVGLGGLGLGAGAVVGAKKQNLNCFSRPGLLFELCVFLGLGLDVLLEFEQDLVLVLIFVLILKTLTSPNSEFKENSE